MSEPYDARLWRPVQSLAGVVTSADRTDPSRFVGSVPPVSSCLAASGLQTGLRNGLLICGFLHLPPTAAAMSWRPGSARIADGSPGQPVRLARGPHSGQILIRRIWPCP